MKIYNTLTRKKEEFKSLEEGVVNMYQCGPTVYDRQHIGNLRATVLADFINRSLKYLGYDVTFVRNYTDVGHLTSDADFGEDKLEKKAKLEELKPLELANKNIADYEEDIAKLNVLEPNIKPRATKYIKEMIEMIQILLDKDFAYQTNTAIYFDISKLENYTKLSGQDLEKNLVGLGHGEITDDKDKKNPQDFVLWFFKVGHHENALQHWQSPFESKLVENGEGFPGWHIECSAMIKKELGDTIDIHIGGVEHIPTHHTNEIAQSESANGVKFVNYWLHNEHLTVDSKKMSKSAGTSYDLSYITSRGYGGLDLRFMFLQAQYRSKQDFTLRTLSVAQESLNNLYKEVAKLGDDFGKINEVYKKEFTDALENDFNTPEALAVLYKVLKSKMSDEDKLATTLDFDEVLGLKINENRKKSQQLSEEIKIEDLPIEVQDLIKQREGVRAGKDWKRSDEIRDKVLDMGYKLMDNENKTLIFTIR
ncbi:cysteine--tRNA ligase [Patescibacteria group bacterium]